MSLTTPYSGGMVKSFLDERTSSTGHFILKETDTEFINQSMGPRLSPVVLSLINDPNVVNSCLRNPEMQQFVQQMNIEFDQTIPSPLLLNADILTSPLSPEDVDVSATASTATLGCQEDYSEDELDSRQTYIGDPEYPFEEDSAYHHPGCRKCFACGQRKHSPRPIGHRPRSSSTSSVGAGSPPKTTMDRIPNWVPSIGGILSLALFILVVKCQSGKDISSLFNVFSSSNSK